MVTIANNGFYLFRVDPAKNTIYMAITGIWPGGEEIAQYLSHLKEALALVRPGFAVLADLREMEEAPMAVQQMHVQAQRLTVEAGISQLAEIHELNNPGSEQAIAMARESNIPLNIFDDPADAEAWLSDLRVK
ncbi:hypothetical protein [Sabulibacter ruber]|uniref:hypothetical protein n=1 Tax=Sabulibacter ruber TaxID=2811901 RepID=UPI001A972E16|nr:hypothetical protein [Sabulibacter ruber]